MNKRGLQQVIQECSVQAIREKVFPGCVVGVVNRDGGRMVIPSGRFTYAADAEPVCDATVYDLASVTKSIPTAFLALTLVAQGVLRLDDRVSYYLPSLCNDHGATIEDLLRYRVHGIALSKLRVRTFEEVRTHALEHGFAAPRGGYVYTNLPAFLLGMIIERVSGASLSAFAHRQLFEPLQMNATTFFPTRSDCAPTEIDMRDSASVKTSAGNEVRGLPHDESAYIFARARRSVGHAGLFSTAPDLLNFLQALLAGAYPSVLASAQAGLGFQVEGDFLGSHASVGSFGKTGFTGTSILVDPEKGIALVILSNRTYPHRPADSSGINAFRRAIADIVLAS